MVFLLKAIGEERYCSFDESISDGSTTLCGRLEVETGRYFVLCQLTDDGFQAPDRRQGFV
jgi:hypothetical protein